MKKFFSMLPAIALAILLYSCGESGPKPAEVTGMKQYESEKFGLSFEYPENWVASEAGDFFAVYSMKEGMKRWPSYATKGAPVAKILVSRAVLDSTRNLDSIIVKMKEFLAEEAYTPMQDLTIDGTPAKTTTYEFDLEDGPFKGAYYFAAKDSGMATIINFEAFAGTWEQYKPTFDKIISGMKLAHSPSLEVRVDTVVEELEPPTMDLAERNGTGFSIGIPGNMTKRNAPGGKGSAESSFYFDTDARMDCSVRIDQFDASKTTDLKKIVDENSKSFKNAKATKTTLAGKEAYVLTWSPGANLSQTVWFVLHNKKLFRVSINWFVPEAKDYLAPLEKSAQSIKFN